MIDFLVNILIYILAFVMWGGLISLIIMIPVWFISNFRDILSGKEFEGKTWMDEILDS